MGTQGRWTNRLTLVAAVLAALAACSGTSQEAAVGSLDGSGGLGGPGGLDGPPASGGLQSGMAAGGADHAGSEVTGGDANPMMSPGPDSDTPGVLPSGGMPSEHGEGGELSPPVNDGPVEGSPGCGAPTYPEAGPKTVDVDGAEREYIVALPEGYDPNRAYRLIFAWHGLGGTAAMIARSWYGLQAHADDSAIFIAGQARPGTGVQSGLASWQNAGDSDIAYTRAMLEWAKTSYCIDTERVFSIGMSNGGMMSNIVGCELGDSFRAMAAMSGGGPRGYAMRPCTGQVAAWISHGNRDNNVPFSYGEASRDYWTMANRCDTATASAMPDLCLEYQGCDDGFPVQFCEFDGGHMVPSFTGEAAWSFFARF